MANVVETNTPVTEAVVEQVKQDAQQESSKAIAKGEQAKKDLANKLLAALKDAQTSAARFAENTDTTGANIKLNKGNKSLLTLIRVGENMKAGVPVLQDKPKAKAIVMQLIDQQLNNATAATIQKQLGDYLIGEKDILFSAPGQPKTDFEKAFDTLKQTYIPAAKVLAGTLINQAAALGQAEAAMRAKFDTENLPRAELETPTNSITDEQYSQGLDPEHLHEQSIIRPIQDRDNPYYDSTYERNFEDYYSMRFSDPKVLNLLASLYDANKFIVYVKYRKKELETTLQKKEPAISDEEVRKKLSKEIRADILSILDRIFIPLLRERPQTQFEEITRKDFYHGIDVTMTRLKDQLETLANKLDAKEQGKPALELFKEFERPREGELIEVEGKQKIRHRIYPIPGEKPVTLSEFIRGSLGLMMSESEHLREYLHNGQTIYHHPADPERGFYSGLSGYAEKIKAVDLDTLYLLPNGQMIQGAFQMYTKYLFQQFSYQDWRHEPGQFINTINSRYSATQEEVIAALRKMYPNETRDRIENAVYTGISMSRTIFLNEPELAAFADPVLEEGKREGTGSSYYINDTTALTPFNALHWIIRWGGEPQIYPYLFAPLGDSADLMHGPWNSEKLLDLGKKYYDSYFKGRQDLHGKKLFIDSLLNMSRTGGPGTRRGWRTLFAEEGHFIFKPNTTILDMMPTWKALENIGYEVMYDLIGNGRLPTALLQGKDTKKMKGSQERKELFSYLFTKYFDQPANKLDEYLKQIANGGARDTALKKIRAGEASPDAIQDQINQEVSEIFLNRTLSRLLAQRLPSRLIQDDRDRFSKDGTSRYKQMWEECQKEYGWSVDNFDKIMKNLGLAEGLLRKEVSENIRKLLTKKDAKDLSEIDMNEIRYRLDGDMIKRLLGEQGAKLSKEEIDRVILLFNKINAHFSGNEDFLNTYARDRIQDKDNAFPFSLALDETDMSLLAFRGTGGRLIPRAIGDIGLLERNLWMGCINKLSETLAQVATDPKKDISPLIQMLKKVKAAYGDVHGYNPLAFDAIDKISAAMIAYFKKDTNATGLAMLLHPWDIRKPHSIAARIAGERGGAVWEWEALDVDKWMLTLETERLLPRDRFDPAKAKHYEPIWVSLGNKLVKLPSEFKFKLFGAEHEIKLFQKRGKDYKVAYGAERRKKSGAMWYHIIENFILKYGPLFGVFVLWKFIKDAIEKAQGTKKQ